MRERLDRLLVQKGFFDDVEKAMRAVMAGMVVVDDHKIEKPGTMIKIEDEPKIRIKGEKQKYVSRGGLKFEKAINVFGIDLNGSVMLDIGASTGGFTDCALQHGAKMVYAVDVGTNQLDWSIRSDPRVRSIENMHANDLKISDIDNIYPDIITVDVSFISIRSIIKNLKSLMDRKTKLMLLIKPQFEAKKEDIEKGGLVKKISIHKKIIHDIILSCEGLEIYMKNFDISPITGTKGNVEYLALFTLNKDDKNDINIDSTLEAARKLGGTSNEIEGK